MINKAAELGPELHKWWPDWRGECAAIVASGPSIKDTDLNPLRDRIHTIVIKSTVERMTWAEVCYGCDAAWWLSRNGVPHKHFSGIKIFHGVQAANRFSDMHKVEIELTTDEMLVEHPLKISNGGNSGHQALNLCVQFGAKDIILLGFDCDHNDNRLHWYGRNNWLNANNPMKYNYDRWKTGFEAAKKGLDKLGIDVVNCSPVSTIKTFRKASLETIMEEWGL